MQELLLSGGMKGKFGRTPRSLRSDLQQTLSVRGNDKLSGIDEGGKRAQLQWDRQPSTVQLDGICERTHGSLHRVEEHPEHT